MGSALRLAGAFAVIALLAGCVARPTGDFGRAAPSVLHDTVMPFGGSIAAKMRDEAVSGFNRTDQEREMHDRTWRFLVAAHAKDWMFDAEIELQRTRLTNAPFGTYRTDRYYNWLRSEAYQSSTVRYATLGRHIQADLDTLPSTFAAICAVEQVDRQRAIAIAQLTNVAPNASADVAARRAENKWHVEWFTQSLAYRYESYSYALDNLLVETPHSQSVRVDAQLRQMAPWVALARNGQFCSEAGSGFYRSTVTIPSRFQTMVPDTEVIDQK